jgi:hypothetical protein
MKQPDTIVEDELPSKAPEFESHINFVVAITGDFKPRQIRNHFQRPWSRLNAYRLKRLSSFVPRVGDRLIAPEIELGWPDDLPPDNFVARRDPIPSGAENGGAQVRKEVRRDTSVISMQDDPSFTPRISDYVIFVCTQTTSRSFQISDKNGVRGRFPVLGPYFVV